MDDIYLCNIIIFIISLIVTITIYSYEKNHYKCSPIINIFMIFICMICILFMNGISYNCVFNNYMTAMYIIIFFCSYSMLIFHTLVYHNYLYEKAII